MADTMLNNATTGDYFNYLTENIDAQKVFAFSGLSVTDAEKLAQKIRSYTTREVISVPFSRVAEVIDESKAKCGDLALIDLFIQGFGQKLVIFIKEFETFKSYPDKELFYSVLRVNIDALVVLTGNDIREVAKELLRNV